MFSIFFYSPSFPACPAVYTYTCNSQWSTCTAGIVACILLNCMSAHVFNLITVELDLLIQTNNTCNIILLIIIVTSCWINNII